jgi:hypothetical protein
MRNTAIIIDSFYYVCFDKKNYSGYGILRNQTIEKLKSEKNDLKILQVN